jgi:hypothetical protein
LVRVTNQLFVSPTTWLASPTTWGVPRTNEPLGSRRYEQDERRRRDLVRAGEVVQLTADPEATGRALAAAAAETDIVLDYLWGEPAARAITALLTARSDRSRPLDWVQIGAVAGPTIELPSPCDRPTSAFRGAARAPSGPPATSPSCRP